MKSAKRRSPLTSTAAKLGELGAAVPQVVTHRVTRMALAGPTLSERDQREFTGMVMEKHVAFTQAWVAMFGEAVQWQGQLSANLLGSLAAPLQAGRDGRVTQLVTDLMEGPMRVVDKGLQPIHQKAVANARRLARTKVKLR